MLNVWTQSIIQGPVFAITRVYVGIFSNRLNYTTDEVNCLAKNTTLSLSMHHNALTARCYVRCRGRGAIGSPETSQRYRARERMTADCSRERRIFL